jgi:phage terminase small subunit
MTKLALIPESDLSPAMQALNPKQRAFALHLFDHADAHYKAAEQAGYTGTKEYLSMQASRLCANEKVQAALREIALSRNVLMVPGALKAVKEITEDIGHKDRLKAATNTLSRAGLDPVVRHEHQHEVAVTVSADEEAREIFKIARELGVDPATVLVTT